MYSPRGVINLAHSDAQRDAAFRRGNAMRLNGIDAEWLDRDAVQQDGAAARLLATARASRSSAGCCSARGGTARHDAVAWGYARGADSAASTSSRTARSPASASSAGAIAGVETSRGAIAAKKVGIAVAGHTGHVAAMAGLRMPIESHVLQAFVSEPIKPMIDTVVTFGAGHFYVSQCDKGELVMGGDLDFYNSYAQRGNLPAIEHAVSCGLAMFPSLSRLRLMRMWGGVMDMTMDGSPIIGKTPIDGFYHQRRLVLWRLQGDAGLRLGLRRHDRQRPRRTSSTPRSRWSASASGAVIDEKGAGAEHRGPH